MDLQGPDMQDTQIAGSPVACWSSAKGPVPGEEIFCRDVAMVLESWMQNGREDALLFGLGQDFIENFIATEAWIISELEACCSGR